MPLRLSKHRILLDGIPLNESQSTPLPSAATLDIWSVSGNVIPLSGSATITGFTPAPQPGTKRTLLCTGTPSFTHSTNLLLPGSADYTATAGDRIEVLAITTTQFRLSIIKASVLPDVQFAKDASGNVTGLLGPDGLTHATLGKNVLTVGAGGRFSTIQGAIDYVLTKPAWTLKQTSAFTCSAWAQNASTLTVNQLPPVSMMTDEWFKLVGDSHYYQFDGSSGTTTILSSMRRIAAAVSGTPAANTYMANVFKILLLDNHYEEYVTITGDCHLQFDGNGGTVWHGGVSNDGMNNGSLSFDRMTIENAGPFMGDNPLGTFGSGNGWSFENAVAVHLGGLLTANALSQDFFSPHCFVGRVTSKHTRFVHHCHVPLAHLNCFSARGDIVFESPVHAVNVESAFIPDCRFVDFPTCRKMVINGLRAVINDPLGLLSNYYVVAGTQYATDVDVSGTAIVSNGTGATNFQVLYLESGLAGGTTAKYSIGPTNISAPYTTGLKKAVNINTVPAAWSATINLQDCPYRADTNAAITYKRWGLSETTAIIPGASPYSYTAPAPGSVVISGGTVSAITRRGINVGVVAGQIAVQVGDVVVTTYTAAPTMTFLPA